MKIRWPSRPPRSLGDGIRIIGYPIVLDNPPRGWSGEPAPVSDVVVSGCEIRSSPQAGVILIGVFGIDMTDVQDAAQRPTDCMSTRADARASSD